ncbi:MAG: arabinan endo-1,5-alpha-L-arabinosidase [Bacteroidota bacterium]|jgi:arabinan endo-1,5-alpha-L-arabinosidase|nr:arabinan endo-1,5-alpha-L-arabinosidase [Bacteroidota bacterium]HHU97552.1 family 43 glycosylhydrolase [Petrimonas sp.]
MKNYTCSPLCLFVSIVLSLVACSCKQKQPYPIFEEVTNPWVDDYTHLSSMEHYKEWGTYNVHDPAIKKFGDYYYLYSTDAIFAENREEAKAKNVPLRYIQVRKSLDLVNWEFVGWAFPEIPEEAVEWVRSRNEGRGATNIWAPYVMKQGDVYRLYFSVSAFGKKTSWIGLAESDSPEGPWVQKGAVVKSSNDTPMNAIDPSVIEDVDNGKLWMHYGSYFGGLYCVELDPATGLTKEKGDLGHLIARRANYRKDNLEAPEIIYNPERKEYYLFVSYDPLMTTYNVRVGRSDKPEGPFRDFFGKNLSDTTNNFPVIVAPYKFANHPGWAGTGHCGVLARDDGRYFMVHQGRLSPGNHLMVLHVRELFFTPDGWPVASPQRFAGEERYQVGKELIPGKWELIRIAESVHERRLEAGQVLWGEGSLNEAEWNRSFMVELLEDGTAGDDGFWHFDEAKQSLTLSIGDETMEDVIVFTGHDWENQVQTVLLSGLDRNGRSLWGKRVE